MSKLKDVTGERFGMLTVIERGNDYISPTGRRIVRWICQCDCGNIVEVAITHLRQGDTLSCGCLGKKKRADANTLFKHGQSKTRIYHLYQNMKYRCLNPKAPNFKTYGGRGITVCDEWLQPDGFERFYKWAMENGYDDNLTIDRIDVNGNYEPQNCRWADEETQYNNTQKSVRLTYKGRTMTATQWAKEIGVDRHTIYDRIRAGKPIEEILGPKMR